MKIENIEEFIEKKSLISNVKKIKSGNILLSRTYNSFYIFEAFFLYCVIAGILGAGIFSVFVGMISIIYFIHSALKNDKAAGFSLLIHNYYKKKINQNNVNINSELGKILSRNFYFQKDIIEIKKYYDSLNQYQKEFYLSHESFDSLLYDKIKSYIEDNEVLYIKNNKDKIIDILINNVSKYNRGILSNLLKEKLKEDREVLRANLNNIFKEDEGLRNEESKSKIINKVIQEI